MPEKVTPEEVEKRGLIEEIEQLRLELLVSKSREKNLQSFLDKTEKNDPAMMLHYEGIILRQRAALNNYTHVMWKRKQTIRELREKVRRLERRNRRQEPQVVVPLDETDHVPQAKTA